LSESPFVGILAGNPLNCPSRKLSVRRPPLFGPTSLRTLGPFPSSEYFAVFFFRLPASLSCRSASPHFCHQLRPFLKSMLLSPPASPYQLFSLFPFPFPLDLDLSPFGFYSFLVFSNRRMSPPFVYETTLFILFQNVSHLSARSLCPFFFIPRRTLRMRWT